MSLPKDIKKYAADWSELAERLVQGETVELLAETVAAAKDARFQFYGFRDALALHDPDNPWTPACLETRVTCPDNPPRIIFTRRASISKMLGQLKKKEPVTAAAPTEPVAPEPKPETADEMFTRLYGLKKPGETT